MSYIATSDDSYRAVTAFYENGNIVSENANGSENWQSKFGYTYLGQSLYNYHTHENKGGAITPHGPFKLYDEVNILAYYAGVLGRPVKNMVNQTMKEGYNTWDVYETWTPTLGNDGYPTKLKWQDSKESVTWNLTWE